MLSVTTETCMSHIDSLLKIRFAIPARPPPTRETLTYPVVLCHLEQCCRLHCRARRWRGLPNMLLRIVLLFGLALES